MCYAKVEQALMETAVLSYMKEVPFEGNSKARFGKLAYNTNAKPQWNKEKQDRKYRWAFETWKT